MKQQLKNTRGETIVEVVVAFVLLLLFTAVFATALRFAQRMNLQADTMRATAFELCGQLYPLGGDTPTWGPDTAPGTLTFQHTTFAGIQFSVSDVTLEQLTASVTEPDGGPTTEYTFHRYGGFKGVGP